MEYKVSRKKMALLLLITPLAYLYGVLQYIFGDSDHMSIQGMLKELTHDFQQALKYVVTGRESVDKSVELGIYDFKMFFKNAGFPDLSNSPKVNRFNVKLKNKAIYIAWTDYRTTEHLSYCITIKKNGKKKGFYSLVYSHNYGEVIKRYRLLDADEIEYKVAAIMGNKKEEQHDKKVRRSGSKGYM